MAALVILERLSHLVWGKFYDAFFWQTFFQKIHFSNWNQFVQQDLNSGRFLLLYLPGGLIVDYVPLHYVRCNKNVIIT